MCVFWSSVKYYFGDIFVFFFQEFAIDYRLFLFHSQSISAEGVALCWMKLSPEIICNTDKTAIIIIILILPITIILILAMIIILIIMIM